MTANDLVDPEPRERLPCAGDEHRHVGVSRPVGEELAQTLCGERPQRTEPPLVSFAVEANPRFGPEVKVTDTQVGDFLDPRAGVVEKQQERVITQGSRSTRR